MVVGDGVGERGIPGEPGGRVNVADPAVVVVTVPCTGFATVKVAVLPWVTVVRGARSTPTALPVVVSTVVPWAVGGTSITCTVTVPVTGSSP